MIDRPQARTIQISDNLIFFILFSLSLIMVYLPCLLIPYAYHDDFHFFPTSSSGPLEHPQTQVCLAIGRFTASILLNFWILFVDSVGDLSFLRFINLLQLSFAAIFLYRSAKHFLKSSLLGYLTVLSIFTLPPFEVMISWAMSTMVATSVLFASFSAYFTGKISHDSPWQKRFLNKETLLCVLFFFLSLSTYPAASGFYWVFAFLAFIIALQNSFKNAEQIIINYSLPAFFSYALLFFYYKSIKALATSFISQNPSLQSTYNINQPTGDIPGKILWFFREPLHQSLNLWNIFPSAEASVLFIFTFTLLMIVWFWAIIKEMIAGPFGTTRGIIIFLVIFFILLTLSFLPNLVATGDISFYRCCAGLTSLVLLLPIILFETISRVLKAAIQKTFLTLLLLILGITGGISANSNVLNYRALPSYLEFEYLKAGFSNALKLNSQEIHIIQRDDILYYPYRYDEFRTLTEVFDNDLLITSTCAFREIFNSQGFIVNEWYTKFYKNSLVLVFTLTKPVSLEQSYTPYTRKISLKLSTSSTRPREFSPEVYVFDKTGVDYSQLFTWNHLHNEQIKDLSYRWSWLYWVAHDPSLTPQ